MRSMLLRMTALAATLGFGLSGCAVGPDFEALPAPIVDRYTPEPLAPRTTSAQTTGGETQRFIRDMDIPGQWWTLFHSPALNALVEEALKNNHDLKAAQAALRVARENALAQYGPFLPNVSTNASATQQKTATGSLSSATTSGASYYSLYTAQVNVSYTPDVFGLTRRTVEATEAQAEAQRFQLEATYLTLTSNVVAAAVQEASLRGQIAATRRIIEIETRLTKLLRQQKALGQVAEVDVAVQEAALAQAQAALPGLEKQLAQQRDLITALIGRLPSEQPAEKFELASLHLPRELPVSLPAKLVQQRPDVRAAEENLRSANAQIGVAIANRLPSITISANAGTTAVQLNQLFSPGNGFWTVGAAVAQTVFDGGTLLHRQRAAEAGYDQALEQYRSTVTTAFQNVADALRALQHDADALKASFAAERAAAKSLDIAQRQLALGAIGNATLLAAQQTYQQALVTLVQAQAARYADTAALFQALGGGWWNRSDVIASSGQTRHGIFHYIDPP